MLLVKVTDTNVNNAQRSLLLPSLKLIITGTQSEAKAAIKLTYVNNNRVLIQPDQAVDSRLMKKATVGDGVEYTVVLDDITTQGLHFAKLNPPAGNNVINDPALGNIVFQDQKRFIPGENITIQAVAYSNDKLTNIAYSGEWTTNSLFAEVSETTTGVADKVYISNIRHLENLNNSISSVEYNNAYFGNTISAVQNTNLDWKGFINAIKARKVTTTINIYDSDNYRTNNDCFYPVSVKAPQGSTYVLSYDGQSIVQGVIVNHSITDISVDDLSGVSISAGGLFGTLTFGEIKNLELINFNVNLQSGDVGALAGTLTGSTASSKVSNVIAYNSPDNRTEAATIKTNSGNAGGLIGKAAGTNCNIEKAAAALIVSSTGGNAGGLIGTAEGGTVTACYSGGFTNGGKYKDTNGVNDIYNVTATGNTAKAGGLIGDAGSTVIENSYSTCSVKGATAGGFVGDASGRITNCYATGLVYVPNDANGNPITTNIGAFAGKYTYVYGDNEEPCLYYEIINEIKDAENGGYRYLTAIGGDSTNIKITALDATYVSYNSFVGSPENWTSVEKTVTKKTESTTAQTEDGGKENLFHDTALGEYYKNRYPLRTVGQLDSLVAPTDLVATHYGDWPAPEIFVLNTPQGN